MQVKEFRLVVTELVFQRVVAYVAAGGSDEVFREQQVVVVALLPNRIEAKQLSRNGRRIGLELPHRRAEGL